MNFQIKLSAIILLVLIVYGCTNTGGRNENIETDDGIHYVKTTKIHGKIIEQQQLLKNGTNLIPQGFRKTFYKSGTLQDSTNYTKGLANGWKLSLYESGKVHAHTYYKDGKKDSTEFIYYENGNISDRLYYWDGRLAGVQYKYDLNGTLSEVYAQDPATDKLYGKVYLDRNGNIIRIHNSPSLLIRANKNTLIANRDTLKVINQILSVPNYKNSLRISIYNDRRKYLDTTIQSFSIIGTSIFYPLQFKFIKAGDYNYRATLLFKNRNGNEIEAGVVLRTISVSE